MTGPQKVSPGVYFVHTALVNWVLLSDDDGVTLIDSGYPGHYQAVLDSITAIGQPLDALKAILLTHAHIDHLGGAQRLAAERGVPVYVHPNELAHTYRDAHHGLTPAGLVANLWRPRVLRWFLQAVPVGVADRHGVAQARALSPTIGELTVPGRPLPIPTPGHTPGHCAFYLPDSGVVISGDALITGHPTAACCGPQLLPAMFDDDRAGTRDALDQLAGLPADILLPGHGPAHFGPVREATALAARHADSDIRR
ncbi:MBL fold metallo-hydrolase (plasmid) [Mycolicibacterium psychrotolerans]|uniref:MBL fold metallo-hydrolase n=1 Tax=Mycolicibacterium psychrotolerans TaxID=216929 RepID=UPI003D67994B